MQWTHDKLISLGETTLASPYPKINLSVECEGKEGLEVRKRINTPVKSTYQSSIHVECTLNERQV